MLLPGILGSELTVGSSQLEKVWFGFWSIFKGDFDQLQLDSAGKSIKPVDPNAALRRYYGELEQYLLADWNVLVFPYDWRLDIRNSADLLADKINAQFGSSTSVHLVAHSMGGLVSRSLAQRHPAQWAQMGKLVMIGTPNYGSLSIAHLYTGLYRLMRILAAVDRQHNLPDLLQMAKNFVGTYQMLPRTDKLPGTSTPVKLYDPATYGDLRPLRDRLDDAQKFQAELNVVHNPERLTYIAGANQPTADGVSDSVATSDIDAYTFTRMGDGTVPHSLGLLPGIAATYFVEEEHSALPSNQIVMEAVGKILNGLPVEGVATRPPRRIAGPAKISPPSNPRKMIAPSPMLKLSACAFNPCADPMIPPPSRRKNSRSSTSPSPEKSRTIHALHVCRSATSRSAATNFGRRLQLNRRSHRHQHARCTSR